jgi:hypothetical protein
VNKHLLSGDWLTLGLGAALVVWLGTVCWSGGAADTLIVRSGGQVVQELALSRDRQTNVSGPLGITRIQIAQRQARVLSDPSPRQYCVKQGWITRAGEAAICLPNQVSIEIGGPSKYDSLNY